MKFTLADFPNKMGRQSGIDPETKVFPVLDDAEVFLDGGKAESNYLWLYLRVVNNRFLDIEGYHIFPLHAVLVAGETELL